LVALGFIKNGLTPFLIKTLFPTEWNNMKIAWKINRLPPLPWWERAGVRGDIL